MRLSRCSCARPMVMGVGALLVGLQSLPAMSADSAMNDAAMVAGPSRITSSNTFYSKPAAEESSLAISADEQGKMRLEEVVVTAEKRKAKLQDTAIAVTVFSGDAMRRSGINRMSALYEKVPNIDISGDISTPSATRITIRGIGAQNVTLNGESGVAFLQDGIYYARPQGANAAFFDIERVEVLRGPQGTLYGRNATGGSINIISKKPKINRLSMDADLSYGNYNAVIAGAAFNVPVVANMLAARLSVYHDIHDGYTKNTANNNLPDLDDGDDLAGRLQILFDPTDNLSVLLRANYFKKSGSGSASKLIAGAENLPTGAPNPGAGDRTPDFVMVPGVGFGKIPRPNNYDYGYWERNGIIPISNDPWKVAYNFPSKIENKQKSISTEINWDLGRVALTFIGATVRDSTFQYYDSDYTNIDVGTKYFDSKTQQDSLEFRIASNKSEKLTWVVGFYYFQEQNKPTDGPIEDRNGGQQIVYLRYKPLENLVPPGSLLPDPFAGPIVIGLRIDNKSYATFGQASYFVTDTIRLTAGLRWSKDEKFARRNNIVTFAIPGALLTVESNSAKFDKITWKGGIDWFVNDEAMLYASVSTGFKPGGLSFTALQSPYDEETVTAYEVGSKAQFLDRRLQVNLSTFYYDYSGLQVSQLIPGVVGYKITNAAKAEVKGLELEWQALATDNLRLNGSVAFLDAKFKNYEGAPYDPYLATVLTPKTVDLSGNRLPNAPEFTISIGADYAIPLEGGAVITPSVRLFWQDEVYMQQYTVDHYRRDPYGKADLLLSYDSPEKNWSVIAFVNNLTQEKTIRAIESTGNFLGNSLIARYASPRTYGVRVHLSF